mmetsp:Transcript_6158/g.10150  ORF Transcript_6158/g.10150 Transcript_6158/m.10150 type:complete len:454 (+) Transcript_6158:20-1381(+)
MALFFGSHSNKKNASSSTKTQQQKREQRKRKRVQMAAEAQQQKHNKKQKKKTTKKGKGKDNHEEREKEVGIFEPSLPNWPAEVKQFIEEQLKKFDYFKKRPHVYPVADFDSFLNTIIALLEKRKGDFCWSMDWEPAFFSCLVYHGFLTIASKIQDDLWVMLPKLHQERCVVDLDRNSKTCHLPLLVSKSTKKKAKKYTITIDQCYERVFQGCIDQHGLNWLYPPMQGVLYTIYKKRGEAQFHGVTSHSIEIWDEAGKLVAGELGTSVGCIYTSLTGFYLESGTGSVQLLALSHLLQKCHFLLWDLGMFIEYKSSLGAGLLPRQEFLAKYRALRDLKTADLVCAEKTNCRDLVNEVINSAKSQNDSNEEKKEDDGDTAMQSNDKNGNDNEQKGDAPKQMSRKEQKRLAKLERRKLAKQRAKAEKEKQSKDADQSVQPDNGDTDEAKDVPDKTGQ